MDDSRDANGRVVVVVSYCPDTSRNPRAGAPQQQQDIYWASIAVNAATLRHVTDREIEFQVHCPSPPPARVATLLDDAQVELVPTPFDHRPPDDFFIRFLASLYLLDVTASLAASVDDDDVVLFVDPDVVWVGDPEPAVAAVRADGLLAYDLAVPPDIPVGRLTRRDEAALYEELTGERLPDVPPHFGGEFYGATGAVLGELVQRLSPLWSATLEQHEQGRRHFNLEEHVLDAALWQLGVREGRANRFIERIMTLPLPFGSRQRYRPELLAWHLPSEKTLGIAKVFDRLVAQRPLPALDEGYHAWMRRRMGIDPTPRHLARDLSRWSWWTLSGAAREGRRRGQVGIGL